jgi:hypothetical protein
MKPLGERKKDFFKLLEEFKIELPYGFENDRDLRAIEFPFSVDFSKPIEFESSSNDNETRNLILKLLLVINPLDDYNNGKIDQAKFKSNLVSYLVYFYNNLPN